MDLGELCDILRRRRIRILPPDDGAVEMRVDAPKGAITPKLNGSLKRHKEALLAAGFWYDDEGKRYWWGRCSRCGAVVQGAGPAADYPPAGIVYCLWCAAFSETSERS